MKTINATLLAAQKNPNAQAIARASLADNGRLHLAHQFTDAWSGGYTRAATCGTFILRARTVPIGTKVQIQKITDPTVEAQWETWTDLDTNSNNTLALAVFWTGTFVVVAYQDATSLDIVYRRSTDGASWSSEFTAYALASLAYISGASGGSAQSGLMVSNGQQLYWGAYDPAANAWTALSSAGLTMTSATVEGDCFYDADNSRHVFVYSPNGLIRWSRFGLVVQTRSTAGSWGTPRVYLQSDNLGVRQISVSQSKLGGRWWLTCTRYAEWTSAVFWLACSDDGVYWEEPTPTDIEDDGHANLITALSGEGHFVATEAQVYQSQPYTYWSNLPVVRYEVTAGSLANRVAGGRSPHMTVVLDNRDGLATAPRLNSVLTLERGFRVAGTDYYVSAGTYYVVGFRYLLDDQLLELHAIDTLGLLTTFVSDVAFNFENETVQDQVELICALAGVHQVTFDASPLWAESAHSFTHPTNANARVSLEALRERVPFEYFIEADGTVNFYVPSASPSATYTYGRGSGEHVYWPGEFGRVNAPTYTRVIGSPPRTTGGEAAHQAEIYAAGRRFTQFVLNRRVRSDTDADALAAAWIVVHTEQAKAGYFEAPPNFALEIGDVVEFNSGLYSDTAGPWRVEQVQELFNHPSGKKFFQRVHVRGTA